MANGKFQYHEQIPANARIVVDYTKPPKDRVAFSYPVQYTLQRAITKAGIATIIGVYLVLAFYIILPILLIVSIGYPILALIQNPQLLNSVSSALTTSFNSALSPHASSNNFTYNLLSLFVGTTTIHTYIETTQTAPPIMYILMIGTIVIGSSLFLIYLKRNPEFAQDWIPKANYYNAKLMHSIRTIKVYPEDITEKIFVLPHFSNVYLDYDTEGSFSANLKKVEVLEYQTNWAKVLKNGKEKRSKPNEYDWRCVFYFKENPKDGYITIKYC